jgi:hypothetical protein
MIELIISLYCIADIVDHRICEKQIVECMTKLNNYKYIDSQWLDVPDYKMSLESLNTCVSWDRSK